MYYKSNYNSNRLALEFPQLLLNKDITDQEFTEDLLYNKCLTFIDNNNSWPIDAFNIHRMEMFSYIEERRKRSLPSRIIFDYSFEHSVSREFLIDYISLLKDRCIDLENVTFIFNTSFRQNYVKEILGNSVNIHFINLFALSESRKVKTKLNVISKLPLSVRDNKLNILVGKIFSKFSRLDGLYYLWKLGLAQNAIKGILINQQMLEENKHLIRDNDFYNWLMNNHGPADSVLLHVNQYTIQSNGSPYSTDIYNKSKVSYIFETSCPEDTSMTSMETSAFITEKTYRPIMNCSPFVLQGHPHNLLFLKELGFNVYDEFLSDRYYENNTDYDTYIRRTTKSAEMLLETTTKYSTNIERIAKYNYDRFNDLVVQEQLYLKKILDI